MSNKIGRILLTIISILFSLELVTSITDFYISSFSCTPSEIAINDVFSCTAQIGNKGTDPGEVDVATLNIDESNKWLEDSSYPQPSGTNIEPGQSTEVTFSGLRAIKSGNNGFLNIILGLVTDNYVATNNIKENVIDVSVTVSNSASSAAMNSTFDVTAQVTAGGNIDVILTFTVDSGGCSIVSQDASKTISDMQDGNKQSRSWTVTQGNSGNCRYTISAAATGDGGIASKIDSASSSVTCTNCPTDSGSSSSSSSGGSGGGGISGTVAYIIGELVSDYAVELAKGEVAIFNISGIEHKIKVENMTATEANIAIQSNVQKFKLVVGDEKSIDLSNDGIADVIIKLKSINIITKKATLILRSLVENRLVEGEVAGEQEAGEAEEKEKQETGKLFEKIGSLNWLLITLVVIILILIVLYIIRKNKRRKTWGLRI